MHFKEKRPGRGGGDEEVMAREVTSWSQPDRARHSAAAQATTSTIAGSRPPIGHHHWPSHRDSSQAGLGRGPQWAEPGTGTCQAARRPETLERPARAMAGQEPAGGRVPPDIPDARPRASAWLTPAFLLFIFT